MSMKVRAIEPDFSGGGAGQECLGQARVESDSKDKSLAVTRCNGVPITLGVVA